MSLRDQDAQPGSAWLRPLRGEPDAPVQLVCLPHAGGSASAFRTWPELLGGAAEVVGVQLPGRGTRLAEEPVADVRQLAQRICAETGESLDRPYALFGQSMGALLAFELARELRRAGRPGPSLLIACSYLGPREPRRASPIADLPAPRFHAELRRLGGTPPEVLGHRDLMRLLTPALRADFAACEGYRYVPDAPLECPILAISGTEDQLVPADAVGAWADETSAGLSAHRLSGGHFLTSSNEAEVIALVARALRGIGEPPAQGRFDLGYAA